MRPRFWMPAAFFRPKVPTTALGRVYPPKSPQKQSLPNPVGLLIQNNSLYGPSKIPQQCAEACPSASSNQVSITDAHKTDPSILTMVLFHGLNISMIAKPKQIKVPVLGPTGSVASAMRHNPSEDVSFEKIDHSNALGLSPAERYAISLETQDLEGEDRDLKNVELEQKKRAEKKQAFEETLSGLSQDLDTLAVAPLATLLAQLGIKDDNAFGQVQFALDLSETIMKGNQFLVGVKPHVLKELQAFFHFYSKLADKASDATPTTLLCPAAGITFSELETILGSGHGKAFNFFKFMPLIGDGRVMAASCSTPDLDAAIKGGNELKILNKAEEARSVLGNYVDTESIITCHSSVESTVTGAASAMAFPSQVLYLLIEDAENPDSVKWDLKVAGGNFPGAFLFRNGYHELLKAMDTALKKAFLSGQEAYPLSRDQKLILSKAIMDNMKSVLSKLDMVPAIKSSISSVASKGGTTVSGLINMCGFKLRPEDLSTLDSSFLNTFDHEAFDAMSTIREKECIAAIRKVVEGSEDSDGKVFEDLFIHGIQTAVARAKGELSFSDVLRRFTKGDAPENKPTLSERR